MGQHHLGGFRECEGVTTAGGHKTQTWCAGPGVEPGGCEWTSDCFAGPQQERRLDAYEAWVDHAHETAGGGA